MAALVLFGVGGDLAMRMLLPTLYFLEHDGLLPDEVGATVKLRVRDHGPGPAEELLTGHGIVGMRDRATLAGGTFSCGAAEGGGFVVDVALPVGEGGT